MKMITRVTLLGALVTCAPVLAAGDKASCDFTGSAGATVCAFREAAGEDPDLRSEAYFFEPSKVLVGHGAFAKGAEPASGSQSQLALEVEFNETIFPYQNRASARDRHFGGWTWAVGLTPMYRVRIWRERSAPVRVPSFMPKGTVQFNRLAARSVGRQWGERASGRWGVVGMTTFMTTIGHHSNGQDGCLFADQSGNGFAPPELCPTDPTDIRVNRLNGSFSTNYVQLSVFQTFFRLRRAGRDRALLRSRAGLWADERRPEDALFGGATYELNFPFDSFGGAIEKPVRTVYGMNRVRVVAGYRRYSADGPKRGVPQMTITAWLQLIDKSRDSLDCDQAGTVGYASRPCAPRWGWGADASVGLGSRIDFLGLYGRFYQGQDYYNLSFTHRKDNRLQFGLSFSPGRSRGPSFPVVEGRVLAEETEYAARGCFTAYRRYVRANARAGASAPQKTSPECGLE
jgi:hypothetical protein